MLVTNAGQEGGWKKVVKYKGRIRAVDDEEMNPPVGGEEWPIPVPVQQQGEHEELPTPVPVQQQGEHEELPTPVPVQQQGEHEELPTPVPVQQQEEHEEWPAHHVEVDAGNWGGPPIEEGWGANANPVEDVAGGTTGGSWIHTLTFGWLGTAPTTTTAVVAEEEEEEEEEFTMLDSDGEEQIGDPEDREEELVEEEEEVVHHQTWQGWGTPPQAPEGAHFDGAVFVNGDPNAHVEDDVVTLDGEDAMSADGDVHTDGGNFAFTEEVVSAEEDYHAQEHRKHSKKSKQQKAKEKAAEERAKAAEEKAEEEEAWAQAAAWVQDMAEDATFEAIAQLFANAEETEEEEEYAVGEAIAMLFDEGPQLVGGHYAHLVLGSMSSSPIE